MHNEKPADDDGCGHRVPKRSLKAAVVLTAVFFIVEVAGGIASGSLSLLGDAAHMLQDVVALLLSLGAMLAAERLPTPSRTFGYHRLEIIAAVVNGFLLVGICLVIAVEAVERFSHPLEIDAPVMIGVAAVGLIVNLAVMYVLHGSHDLNIKGAFLHVVGDTLSSVMVIVAGIWIGYTGQTFIDPLLSMGIVVLILVSSFSLLRDAFGILLQFAPRDVDTNAVIQEIESVRGVAGVHNVHLWSLCSNINVLDAHVYSCETDTARLEEMKSEIKQRLQKYRIKHSTLEFECRECEDCPTFKEIRDFS